ncbi:MAG: guanylate kinase [Candidatus Epulonipiscioides saccharophilum]|nr:MAG: guanylate kinase [Epulopiscium sp. AS2M-Bin001]
MLKIVISGPSGCGKGTVVKELLKYSNYKLSISVTTRQKRSTEEEGVHYFFKTQEEFDSMIAGDELLEYANFCGNFYGTPKDYVDKTIKDGFDIILEIEVEGALKIKDKFPEAILIFLIPPTFTELHSRLVGRQTESEDVINYRLSRAREELALYKKYDYIVINDDISEAVRQINAIVESEKLRSHNRKDIIDFMLNN